MTTTIGGVPEETSAALQASGAKSRQREIWASGDYALIGTTLQIVGERLCEYVDLRAGDRVLDVACGNGNAALAAARRFAEVVGVDYVPGMLQRAGERARGERLDLELRLGDAEHLPFAGEAFDVCLSTFGVMFTPNQELAASELARVCRPGGRIGLASWTPEGFIGQMFAILRGYASEPPPGKSPLLWGKVPHVLELFGARCRLVHCRGSEFQFRYRSADHFIDTFRSYYGPVHQLFQALPADRQASLVAELRGLLARLDRGDGHGLVVPGEYLEIVLEKAG